ncbi:MAG: polymerase [Solirubrobacteraceae bacterium]|nr:polymerase [Solirubrobacteraceae bacterium]
MADLSNAAIAEAFDELADLYELDGAVVHRVLAYRTAAKNVRNATVSVAELTKQGRVTSLPGIGRTLEEKIQAMIDTGTIPALQKLRDRIPPGLAAITRLPGVGPKRVRTMYDQLGIDSLETLRAAAESGRLSDAKGFGPKFQESVLAALEAGVADRPAPRMVLPTALEVGNQVVEALRAHPAAVHVEIAGSARRLADSVKDLDIVAAATDPGALASALAGIDVIASAGSAGENAARGRAHNGLGIDLRVVEPEQFGNLLQHFTGSARHNMALREAAVRRGLHVSEYGILDDATGETTTCATEEEVYERLGLPWIEPELREDRGELAKGFTAPRLVTVEDLRGDLHCHTTLSDGRSTLAEMARAAQARGYEYLAITDHSATHGFGDHVTPDELRRQIERVRALDAELEGMRLLVGTETNILPDGRPDYDDELLSELDWVIASVHTSFAMNEKDMTARMVAAIEHPWIDAIGHPTGRKISKREPYSVDVDALVEAAARTGTMIEINGAPDRRDLDDVHARAAAEAGVMVLIDSDAHGAERLEHVKWAVATARRAWLTADQIANTRSWEEFAGLRKRAKAAAA